jgi:hypothetical protein
MLFALGERLRGARAPRKDMFLYFASDRFLQDHPVGQPDEHAEHQRAFRDQIKATGEHWKAFDSVQHLRAEVLRDWPEKVPTKPTRHDSLSDRQAEWRYLERVIDQHRHAWIPCCAKTRPPRFRKIAVLTSAGGPPSSLWNVQSTTGHDMPRLEPTRT